MSTFNIILIVLVWLLLGEVARLKTKAEANVLLLYIISPLIHVIVVVTCGLEEYLSKTWDDTWNNTIDDKN